MKIIAKASGGLAGRTDCYELDTSCTANGKSVEDLLHSIDFFTARPACGVGADIPHWEITVQDGLRQRTVTVTDDGAGGAGWQALIEHLRNTA
ncbi:MAG TPA: hypothetical protein VNT33_05160 [Telluria sp.]|nr:hypothetical protein [Telluria sp.]